MQVKDYMLIQFPEKGQIKKPYCKNAYQNIFGSKAVFS